MNMLGDPLGYRNLIITEHGAVHDLYPDRYKRFIQANRTSHTALQNTIFYTTANDVPLFEWLDSFLVPTPFWVDIVEDLPAPP